MKVWLVFGWNEDGWDIYSICDSKETAEMAIKHFKDNPYWRDMKFQARQNIVLTSRNFDNL